jgi:hypothetical protein
VAAEEAERRMQQQQDDDKKVCSPQNPATHMYICAVYFSREQVSFCIDWWKRRMSSLILEESIS